MKTVLPILLALLVGASLQSSPFQEKNPSPVTLEQDTSTYEGAFFSEDETTVITRSQLRDSFSIDQLIQLRHKSRNQRPLDSSIQVVKFAVYILPPSRLVHRYDVDSNGFTASIRKQIDSLEPGGRIIIDDIRATGPIRLQPISFTWIDETTYLSAKGKLQDPFWQETNGRMRIKEDSSWKHLDSLLGYSKGGLKLSAFNLILLEPGKPAKKIKILHSKLPESTLMDIQNAAIGSKIIIEEFEFVGYEKKGDYSVVFIKYANIHEFIQKRKDGE